MLLSRTVAYITGAGQGLGRATAQRIVNQGGKVVIVDANEKAVNEVINSLGNENALGIVVDVTNTDQVAKSIESAMNKFGKITAAVNCAGIAPPMRTLGKKGPHSLEQFAKVLNVNTIGTFNVLRLTAEKMTLNDPDSDGIR